MTMDFGRDLKNYYQWFMDWARMCVVVVCTNKTLVNGTVDDSEEFDLDLEKQAENRP